MKKMAVLICVLLFVALIIGCAEQTVDEFDLNYTDDSEYNPFVGYEFIIRDYDHDGTYDIIPVYGENMLDDMMIERYRGFEEEYECTISLLEGDSNGLMTYYAASVDKYADIMYDKINRAFGAIKIGAYRNLYDLDGIDLSSGQFGSQSLLDSLTWNGELYLMYPPTWANHFAHTVLYNPRILRESSITDPHEYNENGEWTWATFETVSETYYNSRTEFREIIAYNPIVTDCALYSNGVKWTKVDETGKRVVAYNTPATTETLEWLTKMSTAGYMTTNTAWEDNAIAFIEGETAFYANYSWMGISKDGGYIPTHLDEEFRWISFPQGPSGSEATGVLTFTNPFFLITSQADTDFIGEFCTILFRQLGDESNDWWGTFNRENFFDDASFEYYRHMLETLTFDYSVFINKTDVVDNQFLAVVAGTKTVAEALNAVLEQTQTNLDSYFAE